MLNGRQLKIIRRMFDAGPEGFTGGMKARKYTALTGTSKATATRDLQPLAQLEALTPNRRRKKHALRTGWSLNAPWHETH